MKQKIGDFEFELKLPNDLPNDSINNWMKEWLKLYEKEKLKEKRELRLKKLNNLNAKNK